MNYVVTTPRCAKKFIHFLNVEHKLLSVKASVEN